MRVFVTGATGFIGIRVVTELLKGGHQVIGLARSDEGAKPLVEAGAGVHRGSLEDLDSLRSGAEAAEGVIHLAFIHNFSKFKENSQTDQRAIEAMGSVLAGSKRPLIVTAGTSGVVSSGQVATEKDVLPAEVPHPRLSEQTALWLVANGVSASVMRLPQVHDTQKQGLVTYAVQVAREKGVSAYVGDGKQRWAAVSVNDVASVYRLALERNEAGAVYHAVGEEGVSMREIAEVIGRGLKVPVVSISVEEASKHFGWLAMFAGHDSPASSKITQQMLGWKPTGPGLIEDLEGMRYE